MKFEKMFRVPIMVMGLGAALLVAKPVWAQQEVDPDHFEAASDSSSLYQADAQAAPGYEAAQTPAIASVEAAPLADQEMVATQLTEADTTVTAILMLGFGSIILLGLVEAMGGTKRRTWKAQTMNGFPVGSTAN